MIARAYDPARDSEKLKALLGKTQANPSRDFMIVVEDDAGELVSAIAFRPMLFVHELVVAEGMLGRHRAGLAVGYAMGAARAAGHREACFIVADEAAGKFLEQWGAVKENPGTIYTMEVK